MNQRGRVLFRIPAHGTPLLNSAAFPVRPVSVSHVGPTKWQTAAGTPLHYPVAHRSPSVWRLLGTIPR